MDDNFGAFFVNVLVATVLIAGLWWLLVLLSHLMILTS
jgi:hypothetical protein